MKRLTIGKWRGLQRCASPGGTFAVLALDHRNNLRRILNPEDPELVTAGAMSAFKQEVVRALAPAASAVLLDPEFGAAQCVAGGVLPPETGLIVAVEATGYEGDPQARGSRLLDDWSVEKAKRMGADAVKLLVYYHPGSRVSGEIERLVAEVAEECSHHDLALILEPLSYSLDPGKKKLSSAEKRSVVVETARRLVIDRVDLLKAEFPVDAGEEPDEGVWAEACRELSAVTPVPWMVLSAGVDFETYLKQVTAACRAGASGVAAGRAVWKELVDLPEAERGDFLSGIAAGRMRRLQCLTDAFGRPFTDFYRTEADEGWFRAY